MAFYIRDAATDAAVRRLAQLQNKSLTETVRDAVEAEFSRERHRVPLSQRLGPLVERYRSHALSSDAADKAFFDELSGDR